MNELGSRLRRHWIGAVAAIWLAFLALAWLLIYSQVPLPRWAGLVRAAKAFVLLAFLLGAAYGWGRLVMRRWHTRSGEAPNPYWAFGLGFGILWSATFAVAALHLLGPAWPWLLLGGGWLALAMTLRPLSRPRLPAISSWTVTEWFLLAVMAASLAYSLLTWALVPPLAWDEVSYHLPIPQIYIQAGGFVPIPTIVHSNWPAGMEMLNSLALLMGSEILPHLTVMVMVVLTALGLARFARQHFDRKTGWLAAALYLTMPMVGYLAGVALIEGALGFFGFLALWSGYEWLQSQSWRDLVLAGILGGLAASIKLTGAALPLTVGAVGFLWLMFRDRRKVGHHIVQSAAYGALALAVVAPWYFKSAIYTGNPVWPFLYSLFGGRYWDAVGDQLHTTWLHRPNLDPTPWNYVTGFWHLTVQAERFGGMRLGAAMIALAPLSALFWKEKNWLLGYLGATGAIVYTIWFFTTHQTRFLMGVVPALVLLAAYAFARLLRRWSSPWAALGRGAMLLYLVALLPFFHADSRDHISARWPYVVGQMSRQEFLTQEVDGYSAFQFVNEHISQDAKVLLAPWETRGYYLERDYVWANPISQRVIRWDQFDDAAALAGFLHSMGVTHVFWNDNMIISGVANEEHTTELFNRLLSGYGTTIYDKDGYTVYELRPVP